LSDIGLLAPKQTLWFFAAAELAFAGERTFCLQQLQQLKQQGRTTLILTRATFAFLLDFSTTVHRGYR
jgi:hypothetical protein